MTRREWLQALREHHHWSQRELARRIGVHQVTVARWETDVMNPSPVVRRLLAILGRDAGLPPLPKE